MSSGIPLIRDLTFSTWIILLLSGVVLMQSGVASPINPTNNRSPVELQNSHEAAHLSANKKSVAGQSPATPQFQSSSTDNRSVNSSSNQNTSVTVDPVSIEDSVLTEDGLKLIQGNTTNGSHINVTAETVDIATISENTSSQSDDQVVFKNISELKHNNSTEVSINNELKTVRFDLNSDELNASIAFVVAEPIRSTAGSASSTNNIAADEPDQEPDTSIEFLTMNSTQNSAELSSFNRDSSEDSGFGDTATLTITRATITKIALVVFKSEDTTKLALMELRGSPSAIETATGGDVVAEVTPGGDVQVEVEQNPTEDRIGDSPILVFQLFPIQSSLLAVLSLVLGWMYAKRKKLEESVISYVSRTDQGESSPDEDANPKSDASDGK